MSINYHAYQNRGFKFSTFEEIEKQWLERFAGYNPERIAGILGLTYDADFLYIKYYGEEYRLNLALGRIEKPGNDMSENDVMPDRIGEPAFHHEGLNLPLPEEGWRGDIFANEAMAIYHILYYTVDNPQLSGNLVSNASLDPRHTRSPQEDVLYDDLSAYFPDKDSLVEACEKAGGNPVISKADASFTFYPFPQIPLQLVYWEADEDFGAQVKVLVDEKITDYVHIETTGCLVSDLFEKIKKYSKSVG